MEFFITEELLVKLNFNFHLVFNSFEIVVRTVKMIITNSMFFNAKNLEAGWGLNLLMSPSFYFLTVKMHYPIFRLLSSAHMAF